MRAAVFEALAGFDKPASAYDIAEAVSKAQGAASRRTASIASSTCSSARTSPAGSRAPTPMSPTQHPDCLHDCIFLICDSCGQTVHIDDDSLSGGVRKAAKNAGFSAPRPVIEVRGKCGECEAIEPHST